MKSPVVLKVRDKEFRIGFVNNYFSVEYYKMHNEMIKAGMAYYDNCVVLEKLRRKEISTDEASKKTEEYAQVIHEIGTREFFERRLELVKEALESNNIEYDRKFWERKTSPNDLVAFLEAVYRYEHGVTEEPNGVEKPKKANQTKR